MNKYAELILDMLPNEAGYSGEVVGTGGNCTAISIDYGHGELLLTDGDASAPEWGDDVMLVNYPRSTDEGTMVALLCTPAPRDVAQRVSLFLNGGE